MKNAIATFIKYRPLLNNLISRDIKVKYRRSFLGILWSVLNPLLMMIVMTIVFSHVFKFEIENFPIYYLCGSLIFNFFSEATQSSMSSIINNSQLLKKVYIPKYVFPLERVLFALVNMLFSTIADFIVLIFQPVEPSFTMFLIPIPILYTFLFALGLSLLLSAAAVFFRDLIHLFSVVLTAWMYLTPLFYPLEILPDWLLPIVSHNPLCIFITYFRDVFMYGTIPSLETNLICVVICIVSIVVGMLAFKKSQDKFILYI